MNKKMLTIKRTLILLALGGSAFSAFGVGGLTGCNYADYGDYQTMYTATGQAIIQSVSNNVFGNIGADYDAWVRNPTTAFAQSAWANWVDVRVPDDLAIR
ncbi:MAG: hypothetical protein KAY37_16225 [Phycisphaerae bacterium]|nr:hypothetical protein [Phycisphaerae bacterium]